MNRQLRGARHARPRLGASARASGGIRPRAPTEVSTLCEESRLRRQPCPASPRIGRAEHRAVSGGVPRRPSPRGLRQPSNSPALPPHRHHPPSGQACPPEIHAHLDGLQGFPQSDLPPGHRGHGRERGRSSLQGSGIDPSRRCPDLPLRDNTPTPSTKGQEMPTCGWTRPPNAPKFPEGVEIESPRPRSRSR